MRPPGEWLRSLPSRINTSARWLIAKARGTSKSTRIAIGIGLIILYWIYPAEAKIIYTPEIDPGVATSALALLAGSLLMLEARIRR